MTYKNKELHENAIARFLQKPYSRILIPQDDGGFTAEVLEFPGCFTEGASADEAYRRLEDTAASWIGACLDTGKKIPAPLTNYQTTGRFALRLPRSLYGKAAKAAAKERISLNQFICTAVAERIGTSDTRAQLDEVITEIRRLHVAFLLIVPEKTAANHPGNKFKGVPPFLKPEQQATTLQ